MKKSGGGAIVNISSMAAIGFQAYSAPEYSASKAAIVRLTSSLTNLHDSWNVRVNCICPGWVATQAVKRKLSEMTEEEKAAESFPPPRVLIQPEEIAEKVWMFITNDDMAGKVMIWPDGDSPKLIDVDSEL
jgi:NAD(P)-dependent dehydrogenase (short-subunit alcohol dehydrogenase family)